jgi:hypothetical protein
MLQGFFFADKRFEISNLSLIRDMIGLPIWLKIKVQV